MIIDVRHGDSTAIMATLDADSVDAVVTDPPYGLAFMGKDWDHGVPGVEFWREALRVAKPGAHLLAFGGTRTYHRLACAIEDAGWEIRDCVMWVYGSGFPKSHDVSKAIDKRKDWKALAELGKAIKAARVAAGLSQTEAARLVGLIGADESLGGGGFMWFETGRLPTRAEWPLLKHALQLGDDFDAAFEEAEREVIGDRKMRDTSEVRLAVAANAGGYDASARRVVDITAPATDAARQWSGWGTALKPAYEPIIVARKPLCSTVAETVLRHGTGALNIDGCRAGARWPANVIHDGVMHEHGRYFYCAKAQRADRDDGCDDPPLKMPFGGIDTWTEYDRRRGENAVRQPLHNHHPTVKPTALMTWLCQLVTPPGGVVLDPFCGSGSTGRGAIAAGAGRFVGIDQDEEYCEIARRRVAALLRPMDYMETR